MAFNSQRTFRAPTFRSQLSVRRVYETLEPKSEMKETSEAYFLHVYLPGYTKNQPKITLQDASLRITGERPIPKNKWEKFDQTYPIPENSNARTLEARFEQDTLILKMQKKLISQSQVVAPKEEVEKSQQDPSSNKDLDEAKLEKVQETIPPIQSTTKIEEAAQDIKSDSPQTQSIEKKTQEVIHDDTLSQIAKEAINNNEPQKGQQEFETKPTFKDTSKTQIDEKEKEQLETKPTFKDTVKTQEDEKAQRGTQEFEPKPTFKDTTKTQFDEKAQKSQEEFEKKSTFIERTKTQIDEKAQKGPEEFEPTPKEKVVTKEKLEENIVRKSDEDAEEERISRKEEIEEKNEKPNELSKTIKDVKENEIEKEEKNGIRKLVDASTQFVTRVAEGKWRGDERHLVENVGAAVLVIAAFGAYISYRFSS